MSHQNTRLPILLRYLFALVLTVLFLSAALDSLEAATASNADTLYDLLTDQETTLVSLGGNITIRRADPDDEGSYLDFLVSDIDRTVAITSNGKTIRYGNGSAEEDNVEFQLQIVDGGELKFMDQADIAGGFGYTGGLFLLEGSAKLTFQAAANLSGNSTSGDGGALLAEYGPSGSSPVIEFKSSATLSGNQAEGDGGAVSLLGGDHLVQFSVRDQATFSNNKAEGVGGALSAYSGLIQFDGTLTVTGNRAQEEGGAFYLYYSDMKTIGKATFQNNAAGDVSEAPVGGGAIYASSSKVTFDGETLFGGNSDSLGNSAVSYGGAIYADTESVLTFGKLATFQHNKTVYGDGGALALSMDSIATFKDDALFENNNATDGSYGGGAIFLEDSVIEFKGKSTFNKNKALVGENDGNANGGAVYISGQSDLENPYSWNSTGLASFTSNEAALSGGAIYADYSTMKFGAATFTDNKSNGLSDEFDLFGGGALFADQSLILFDGALTMKGNQAVAGDGGAVFARMTGLVDETHPEYGIQFNNTANISENSAKRHGGAFYLEDSAISFGKTTTIENNSAQGQGGAFYVSGSSMIGFQAGSQTTISGNSATQGGAIMIEDSARLVMDLAAGSSASPTSLIFEAETTKGKNDIHLGELSEWAVNTNANSVVRIGSALTSTDDSAILYKYGSGDLYFDSNSTGFNGQLYVDNGTVHFGPGTFGNTNQTTLLITATGSVVLTAGQIDPTKVLLSLKQLDIDPRDNAAIIIKTSSSSDQSFQLIALNGDGNDVEYWNDYFDDLFDNELISLSGEGGGSFDFLQYNHTVSLENGDAILSVSFGYDPDSHEDGVFNLTGADDRFTVTQEINWEDKPITINGAGTLALSSTEGNSSAGLVGNGGLEIAQNSRLTLTGDTVREFTGSLAGKGDLIVALDDGGVQKLLGTNVLEGTTTVQSGTLLGNTKTLQHIIEVQEAGTLIFDQNTLSSGKAGTFSGTLTGEGKISFEGYISEPTAYKQGVCSVQITDDNSAFNGDVTVDSTWLLLGASQSNARALTSGGSLSAKSLTVTQNGGIGGAGTFSADVFDVQGGIMALGGNLRIDNTQEFQIGGTVYVFVNGANTNLISVAGDVSVDDAQVKITGVGAGYVYDEYFDFLKSESGSISGNFASDKLEYTDSKGTKFEFELEQTNNNTYGMVGTTQAQGTDEEEKPDPGPGPGPVGPGSVTSGLSANQAQVTQALDYIDFNNLGPDGFNVMIGDLGNHVKEENDVLVYDQVYRDITKQLSGAVRAEGLRLGLHSPAANIFSRLSMDGPLDSGSTQRIYNGGYGPLYGAIPGLQRHGAGAGPDTTVRGQYDYAYCGHCCDNGCGNCCYNPCNSYGNGVNQFWAQVVHVQTNTDGDDNADSHGISRTGILIGLDCQKLQSLRTGVLFGYYAPYLWQNADRVEADDYHAGLYLQKHYNDMEIYGYFGYAHQEYNSERYVDMTALGAGYGREQYKGSTKGDTFAMSLEFSKPCYYENNITVRPLLGFDYLHTTQKGYTETGTGTGLYALDYDQIKHDRWFIRVGADLKKETANWTSVLRVQYINQFDGSPAPNGSARFAQVGGSPWMTVHGVDSRRDYLNAGFGINMAINEARSKILSFDYDGLFSKRTKSHGFSLIYVEKF